MSDCRLVAVLWPKAEAVERTNIQISPDLRHVSSHTFGDEVTRRHICVSALLMRDEENQILRTVTVCGGLSGGDSNELALL